MKISEDQYNSTIEGARSINEFWFTREQQNKWVFRIAAERAGNGYDDVELNIKVAQDTVQMFFDLVLKPTTRRGQ